MKKSRKLFTEKENKMKKMVLVMTVLLVLLVAMPVFADGLERVTGFGDWGCYKTVSMLDGTRYMIAFQNGNGQFMSVLEAGGELYFGVEFNQFVSSAGVAYTAGLIWATDATDAPRTLFTDMFLPSNELVRIQSSDAVSAVLSDLLEARAMIFRVYDDRDLEVDAVFDRIVPSDTKLAIDWLKNQ